MTFKYNFRGLKVCNNILKAKMYNEFIRKVENPLFTAYFKNLE